MNHKDIIEYTKNKLSNLLETSVPHVENAELLRASFRVQHKGCYIGVVDAAGHDVLREGFMSPSCENVLDSVDGCIDSAYNRLKEKNFSLAQLVVSTIIVTIVEDCRYIADPLQWDIDKDGVYFQWGDRYKGLYLPYQIRRMNLTKTDVLDRLVSFETNLSCSLWRCPEGCIWSMKCITIN